MRPTYRSLNRIATFFGCERRLFMFGIFAGYGAYVSVDSLYVGLLVLSLAWVVAYLYAKDPVLIRILMNGPKPQIYDACKRRPFQLVFLP